MSLGMSALMYYVALFLEKCMLGPISDPRIYIYNLQDIKPGTPFTPSHKLECLE